MMEPRATIAAWRGNKLPVWASNQLVGWTVGDLAKTLGTPTLDKLLAGSPAAALGPARGKRHDRRFRSQFPPG